MSNYNKKLPTVIKCGLNIYNELLSGKWKLLILYFVDVGYKRPNELLKMIPNLDRRVLDANLSQLLEYGFLNRVILSEKPLFVAYELSELASNLMPIIEQLDKWGRYHFEELSSKISTEIEP